MKTILASLLLLAAPLAHAHPGHTQGNPAPEMTAAANALLATLTDEQKTTATFAFDSDERENWHFVPLERKGISLAALTPAQDHLAYALLSTGLSQKGMLTAASIMSLEQFLAVKEDNPAKRNTEHYYLAIFGTPSTSKTWGWRFEGHHLSLNFTLVNGRNLATTPSFFGTNPAEIKDGPRKGLRPLGGIEESARLLAVSLHDTGKPVVFSEKAPKDVLTGQNREAKKPESLGVMGSDMTPDQKMILLATIREFATLNRPELSGPILGHIEKSVDKLQFAWAGGLKPGDPHYFRIVGGDTFVIEYANTQNGANHAHAVWRLFKDDFARNTLLNHLKKDH